MKKVILLITLCVSGCTLSVKPDPKYQEELEKKFSQHAVVINAIAAYIQHLQEQGVLPKPEEKKAE